MHKTIILPRHARDKHRENTQLQDRFFTGLVVLVALVQAGFVLAPLLLPMLVVWQRGSTPNPLGSRFPIEHVWLLGNLGQMENFVFFLGFVLIVVASVNNFVYLLRRISLLLISNSHSSHTPQINDFIA